MQLVGYGLFQVSHNVPLDTDVVLEVVFMLMLHACVVIVVTAGQPVAQLAGACWEWIQWRRRINNLRAKAWRHQHESAMTYNRCCSYIPDSTHVLLFVYKQSWRHQCIDAHEKALNWMIHVLCTASWSWNYQVLNREYNIDGNGVPKCSANSFSVVCRRACLVLDFKTIWNT